MLHTHPFWTVPWSVSRGNECVVLLVLRCVIYQALVVLVLLHQPGNSMVHPVLLHLLHKTLVYLVLRCALGKAMVCLACPYHSFLCLCLSRHPLVL